MNNPSSPSQKIPASIPSSDYIYKPYEEFIYVIEQEFFQQIKSLDPSDVATSLLPNAFHYLPDNFFQRSKFL